MYVITGASGNIGKILVSELLSKGKKVRAIARNAEKLQPLAEKGAEIVLGNLHDLSFLMKAFKGATAVFCMVPPNYKAEDFRNSQKEVANNLFEAVKSNKVKNVVLLSSIGAHLRNGAGVVDGLGYLEQIFSELKDVNVVNLRPSYFMENLMGQIGTIKHMGIAGSPINGDLKMPMVATKDIAQVAFKLLNDLNFKGHTIQYVIGPRDISYNEIAPILGKAIGKPDLKYVQFSYEDAKKGMVESGFVSAGIADLFNELAASMNNGTALSAHTRAPENSTPTDVTEFAHVFAHVYNMA
jgi:uncharacterized protein YbjT (DUF2867 family)